ncbi:MAG: DUF4136 domain-containing protein [Planctomycetota bacterium]
MRIANLLAAACTALAASCAAFSTSHDWDPAADFGALHDYAWIEPPKDAVEADLVRKRAVVAFDEELARRGYTKVDADPDFLVAVHLGTERHVRVTDWGYGYGPYWSHFGPSRLDVVEYEQDTLMLDVVLAATKELVWRGRAEGDIDPGSAPEKRMERMREVARELLGSFPPTTGG